MVRIVAMCMLVITTFWCSSVSATQLLFEQIRDINGIVVPAGNGGLVPQDYGDRVTGASQSVAGGTFTYGNLGEGFTPNVVVSYGPFATVPQVWSSGYGNLSHVAWTSQKYVLEIVLTADPGFLVKLRDFDLGGWPNKNYIINSIQVFDGANSLLYNQNNALVEGDANGPGHSHFDIDQQAATLVVRIDSLNLGDDYDNIGIDNIRFSQFRTGAGDDRTVPEPSAALLMAAGLLAFFSRRRCKQH